MSMALKYNLALYADDSALIASGPDADLVAAFLSEQLTSCRLWLIKNRLSYQCMLVRRNPYTVWYTWET